MKKISEDNINISPGTEVLRYQKIVYAVVLAISVIWCAAILLAPMWTESAGFLGQVSAVMYSAFSKACHQLDDRSLHAFGHKLGVCSRCTLIYFGFLAGAIVYPFVRKLNNNDLPSLWILFIGAGLVALDGGLDTFDLWKNTYVTREITGAILGVILAFFLVPGFIRLFDEFFDSRTVKSGSKN